MNFSEVFIRRPIATSLLMAALALVGIVAFPLLPVAPLPQVDFPTINVTATLTGASPEIMGSTVATPLEFQFGQIAGVSQMSSVSSLGSTVITLQFDLNRNIDGAALTCRPRSRPLARLCRRTLRRRRPSRRSIRRIRRS
jgi:multidrug efflux pump